MGNTVLRSVFLLRKKKSLLTECGALLHSPSFCWIPSGRSTSARKRMHNFTAEEDEKMIEFLNQFGTKYSYKGNVLWQAMVESEVRAQSSNMY